MPAVAKKNERDRDQRRKREAARVARTIEIPRCQDRRRRKRLEADVFAWLRHYAGDVFTRDFTDQQREMIAALHRAISEGGDQALAASRGEGKTTVCERVLGYCILSGKVSFAVLFSATGADAEHSLAAIKSWLEHSDELLADYPEVCFPIRALEHTPHRAHYQQVTGWRHDNGRRFAATPSRFKWCGREVILPRVPGSPANGAIIATRGLDGAVRGLKIDDRRPEIAAIDDPDTPETVNSDEQRAKLEAKIDKAIGGLGGQQRPMGRVMLTTIQRRGTVSDRFTDPKLKPSWRGKRFRFLVQPPERSDLWDEYVSLRSGDYVNETSTAAEFLDAHFEAMHLGAIVGNPYRTPGGQRSALQFYFDEVARVGREAVATELDNDPPEETGPVESGLTPHRIQRQLSGYERLAVPPKCTLLTAGVDVRKAALHYTVFAWEPDFTGYCVQHEVFETTGTRYGTDDGADRAVHRAILGLVEQLRATQYAKPDGELLAVDTVLVDSGWQTQAVYAATLEAGQGIYPSRGHGHSAGCTQANFSDLQRRTPDRKPGDGWFLSREGRVWLCHVDVDRYKRFVHDRFLTQPGRPGCFYCYGEPGEPGGRMTADEQAHFAYAHHICAEAEIEEIIKGALRRRWKSKSQNNHWLDATVLTVVGASMRGVRLPMVQAAKPVTALPNASPIGPAATRPPTLRELLNASRGR